MTTPALTRLLRAAPCSSNRVFKAAPMKTDIGVTRHIVIADAGCPCRMFLPLLKYQERP